MEFENPGAGTTTRYYHDGDGDGDGDIDDYLSYELCLTAPPDEPPDAVCLAFHDFDVAGESDGRVDLDDFGGLLNCFRGSGQPPPPECFRPAPAGEVPGSGSFALHGSMVDVLSGGRGPGDELALQYSRARYFDLKHGRFLQRDPKGYIDGANLYEAFASNPARFTDPMGEGVLTWVLVGDYDLSDLQWVREHKHRVLTTPVYGFFEGAGRTIKTGATELGVTVGYNLGLADKPSRMQQRLINLVEAEYIGGATADETASVMGRAVAQGVVDFFGASNVATSLTGELVVYADGGEVYIQEVGAYDRLQAGVAGVGQFSASVSGLHGGMISRASQLELARGVLYTAGRLAPANKTTLVQFTRAGLAIERAQYALETPQAAAYAGLAWSRGGPGLPSGMGFSGDAAWLSTTTAGRFGALDRLATARQIKSATPGRGVTAGGKYDVGEYAALRRRIAEPGLEAHHVGQQALMKRYVPGYDPEVAPAILVPKVGHTIRGPQGIVSRSTSGISSARQAVARDIFELRRVYPGVPNSQLKTLIEMNKQMYPAVRVKP